MEFLINRLFIFCCLLGTGGGFCVGSYSPGQDCFYWSQNTNIVFSVAESATDDFFPKVFRIGLYLLQPSDRPTVAENATEVIDKMDNGSKPTKTLRRRHKNQNTAESPYISLVFWSIIFAVFFVIGIYITLKLREGIWKTETVSSDELLLRFSRLYDQNILSKAEYRAIKMQFADTLTAIDPQQRETRKTSKKSNKKRNSVRPSQMTQAERELILQSLLKNHEDRE